MDLRVVPIDDGRVTVMDRDNLEAGAIYIAPEGLSYHEAVRDATRWAERHNAENVVDRAKRILDGEEVDGLRLDSPGITREYCESVIEYYQKIIDKLSDSEPSTVCDDQPQTGDEHGGS